MTIKREYVLNEEDIKEAIKDFLSYDLDDVDKASVELKVGQTTGVVGFIVNAICKEEIGDA